MTLNTYTIFVGSSSEYKELADYIRIKLDGLDVSHNKKLSVQVWHRNVFEIGDITLDRLLSKANEVDFAIMIFGQDSKLTDRNIEYNAPRDNVLFEFGLFLGVLGIDRTFIISHDDVKLPSDIDGLNVGRFKSVESKSLSDEIDSICDSLARKIFQVLECDPIPEHKLSVTDLYGKWWDEINSSRSSKEIVHTMEGIELQVSPATFSPDVRLTYSPIVVYKRLPKNLSKKRVLDMGTGCGILAIAAALRGASEVHAVDINHAAIEDAQHNINKLILEGRIEEGVITVIESDLFTKVKGRFDFILANLPISADAESWEGLGDSVENIIGRCIDGIDKHLKKNGTAIFAWASFGPEGLVPNILESKGFYCTPYYEDTFMARWYAYVVKRKN